MYRTFFGLSKDPFSMAADPEFMMQTTVHREALAGLTYFILARRGIAVLTGDVGTGKTTVLTKVLQFVGTQGVRTSVILNPILSPAEFLEAVLIGFGLEPVPSSKTQRLRALEQFLIKMHEEGKIVALCVDEAHSLPCALLEEIRLLGNVEFGGQKLLQILMLGQNELDGLLNRDDLRQFKQRIALRFSLGPLTENEVGAYMQHRWSRAGGALPAPFTPAAVTAVGLWSKGFPRLINAVCDNALLLAFGEQSALVTDKHVQSAADDLQLSLNMANPAMPETALTTARGTIVNEVPAADPAVALPAPFRDWYPAEAPSLLTRWAGWLGLARKAES